MGTRAEFDAPIAYEHTHHRVEHHVVDSGDFEVNLDYLSLGSRELVMRVALASEPEALVFGDGGPVCESLRSLTRRERPIEVWQLRRGWAPEPGQPIGLRGA